MAPTSRFEVVGRPELMVQAYEMARVEGTVTLVGMPAVGETVTLPAMSAVFSGKRLVGSAVGGSQVLRDVPRFVRLAEAGLLDLGSLVSRHIRLDEINDGIDGLQQRRGHPHRDRLTGGAAASSAAKHANAHARSTW